MSERNDAGQFTSAEPLTGQLGVEADAGFRPMPEATAKPESEVSTLETEAAHLAIDRALRDEAAPQDEELSYLDATGERIDPKETISLAKAASDISSYHASKVDAQIQTNSSDLAAQVDQLRAAAIRENPALAEHYGVDAADVLAKAEATEQTRAAATAQDVEPSTPGLDPEVEKAMRLPQVREAIESELAQSYQAREQYTKALDTASAYARAAFLDAVPELAGLPESQIEAGLLMLQQTNPQRFAAAMNTLTRVSQIQNEQGRMQQQQVAVQQKQFQEFAKAEDAKFRTMVDAETVKAIGPELGPYFEELGVGTDELLNLWQSQPWIRSAAGQKIVADAVRFRLSQKQGSTWKDKAAPASLPPVAKPGTRSGVRANSDTSQVAALERQLDGASGNKALKISAQLLALKRTAANR
jgi:hypothetical protein